MNKEEFAKRLQENKAKYYRMAYSYVKNEHDALDIVGEAVYKGLKNLRSLRQEEYFDTWMTRIVVNAALDFLRRSSRTSPVEDNVLELIPRDEKGLEPEASMDLYAALDCLSAKDRSCVVLKFFEEYTFAQISDILGEAEPTVKSRVYRSLAKMRAMLEEGAKQK